MQDVLKELEEVPTDNKDRPYEAVKIVSTTIVVNPGQEAEEAERVRRRQETDEFLMSRWAAMHGLQKDRPLAMCYGTFLFYGVRFIC